IDKHMLYLIEQGIAEWDSAVTYSKSSLTKYNGVIYISKSENVDKLPPNNISIWGKLIDIPTGTTTQKGLVQLSSSTSSTSELTAATSLAVKNVMDKANSAFSSATNAN